MNQFEAPQTYNLLELTGGNSELLGNLTLPANEYEQIRFILSAPDEGTQLAEGNSGSWVNYDENAEYNESVDQPLFVPSAAQTGYKAESEQPFVVPENGTVAITAEFDVRKALVDPESSGTFILKPVLRLVVNNQAGSISGSVTAQNSNSMVVYAYEAGTFDSNQPNEGDNGYPNAVTSVAAADDGSYTLAFLAEGSYDLVVAQYDPEGEYIAGSGENVDRAAVSVTAGDESTGISITEDD